MKLGQCTSTYKNIAAVLRTSFITIIDSKKKYCVRICLFLLRLNIEIFCISNTAVLKEYNSHCSERRFIYIDMMTTSN